jgi:cation diffusion facilitator CzcD-associated flavoprotein CzcO
MESGIMDWLIVGAGPQGMMVAVHLRRRGVPAANLRVLDPEPEPLARWRQRTAAVGMSELRSPAWFHLDEARASLLAYASSSGRPLSSGDARPSLALFDDHARFVLDSLGIGGAMLTGTARSLTRDGRGWCVHTDRGSTCARIVVLALGDGDRGEWPPWARSLTRRGASIGHVLEPGPLRWHSGSLAVVGGGLSAAQVALAAAARGQRVTMFARRPLRVASFDTHPRWFQNDSLLAYRAVQPVERRRGELARSRNPGTVNPAAASQLARCLGEGPSRVTLLTGPIERVSVSASGVRFTLRSRDVVADHVVLATGFAQQRRGPCWIETTARTLGLPVTQDGQPIPDGWLQWAPGLYLTGALAELQLGPTAPGLAGGRQAAQIIAQHACGR